MPGTNGDDWLGGTSGNDTLFGEAGDDWLWGKQGNDILDGGTGFDWSYYYFSSGPVTANLGAGTASDGDGGGLWEPAATVAGHGGFAASAELVIVTTNIAGAITTASAAAAIGSAASAYTAGAMRLFAVDNGSASALFLFTSAGADAAVSDAELTRLAGLTDTAATATTDYVFMA